MQRLKEMQEKRNKQITDAHAVAQLEVQTAETRSQFDAMMADVVTLEGDIARRDSILKLEAENRNTVRPPRPNPNGADPTAAEERTKLQAVAFDKFVRRGMSHLTAEERSALEYRDITTSGVGGTVSGATMIPQQFLNVMVDAKKLIGNTVSVVRQKVTNNNGAPIKVAMSNDTGNTLTTLTAEASVIGEQDPAFSGFVMSTDTVATLVKVSRQELDDSYFDLNSWLRDKFGLRYYRGLETLITAGNGSNVASIIAGATLGATSAAPTGPVYADFVAIYAALDPAYYANAKWAMSNKTRAFIMGQVDSYGRPLFIPSPNSGTLDSILGSPIVLNQALTAANVAGDTGVLFGDFLEGYILRTDGDLSILRLDERFADTLEVGFIGYGRVGGASTDAGTHPILKLVTHA